MKLNLWWILMGEKEFLTISLWKNIHWWCPKQILSPALSQSCIWKERWSVEGLGWVSGVSCTDCRCPSPKPRATTPSWASLVPSSEHLEQCWECLRYCCTCLSTPHPPGIHVGFQSHSCHPPPAPTTGMTPVLGYPRSNNSHYPKSWGTSAPRTAITPNSWNPSSNNRNSPNLTVSSQTKSKGNLKTLFFFCQQSILFCSREGGGNRGPKGKWKVGYRNFKNLIFRPVTHCWIHTQVLNYKPMCFESWFQVSASNFLERLLCKQTTQQRWKHDWLSMLEMKH